MHAASFFPPALINYFKILKGTNKQEMEVLLLRIYNPRVQFFSKHSAELSCGKSV